MPDGALRARAPTSAALFATCRRGHGRLIAFSNTTEVRRVLLHADDPHKALFVDLPAIFGEGDAKSAAAGIEAALRELSGLS